MTRLAFLYAAALMIFFFLGVFAGWCIFGVYDE
jgi:hypothetical protein